MQLNDAGIRPRENAPLSDSELEQLCGVCPGIVHSGMPKNNLSEGVHIDPIWGPIERICMAYASNDHLRYKAATGGALSAIAGYLIESRKVDAILHVGASGLRPYFGHSSLSTDISGVNNNCGSIYASVPPLEQIMRVINEKIIVAVIAKPCDISAIRLLSKTEHRVNEYIPYMLSPFCGGFFPPFAMKNFLSSEGIGEYDVESVSYRGNGCPGPTIIKLKDGRKIEKSYLDFWGTDSSQWHMPWRCRICPDGSGEAADISAGDTWPDCTPTKEMINNDLGTNAVITRTPKGDELLRSALNSDYLTLYSESQPSDMNEWQPHLANKKIKAEARFEGMRSCGQNGLITVDLRSDTLSERMSIKDYKEESKGTAHRIHKGKHSDNYPSE